jgi:hypothetical protein
MPVVAMNSSFVVRYSPSLKMKAEITNHKLQITRLDLPIARPYPQFFEAVNSMGFVERQLCPCLRPKT